MEQRPGCALGARGRAVQERVALFRERAAAPKAVRDAEAPLPDAFWWQVPHEEAAIAFASRHIYGREGPSTSSRDRRFEFERPCVPSPAPLPAAAEEAQAQASSAGESSVWPTCGSLSSRVAVLRWADSRATPASADLEEAFVQAAHQMARTQGTRNKRK